MSTPEIELIREYRKTPTEELAERLLLQYQPFLKSWVFFLQDSTVTPSSFQSFLKYFKFGNTYDVKHYVLVTSLQSYEEEDLTLEVTLIFLQSCASSSYPFHDFQIRLMRRVKALIEDPLVFGSLCHFYGDSTERTFSLEENISPIKEPVFVCEDELVLFLPRPDGSIAVNDTWVQGFGVKNEALASISPQDREILLRTYGADQTAKEIAQELGRKSEQVIWNSLSKARQRLLAFSPS